MLILASKSLIRQKILSQAGVGYLCEGAAINERKMQEDLSLGPPELALHLACAKAKDVASRHPEAVVVGADQVLEADGIILHKPADLAEARQRLEILSGRQHQLHTAAALVKGKEVLWSHAETATLLMRPLSTAEIDLQLASEGAACLQSPGAYRLEGPGLQLFERLDGDHFAMLGLPLLPLLEALRLYAPQSLQLVSK